MTKLAATAFEIAVPIAKPLRIERRFERRGGADGSALWMEWRKLIGAVNRSCAARIARFISR